MFQPLPWQRWLQTYLYARSEALVDLLKHCASTVQDFLRYGFFGGGPSRTYA